MDTISQLEATTALYIDFEGGQNLPPSLLMTVKMASVSGRSNTMATKHLMLTGMGA